MQLLGQISMQFDSDGYSVGGIAVTFPNPVAFTNDQISLLETFADQAVIAIENTRLFNELQE